MYKPEEIIGLAQPLEYTLSANEKKEQKNLFQIYNQETGKAVQHFTCNFENILEFQEDQKLKMKKYIKAQNEAYEQAVADGCPTPGISSLLF